VNIRDRIKELRRVPADQLQPNPKNWRKHPESQANALRGVLAEVGIAAAVLARETAEGGLMLIDGHLRTDVMYDQDIPVLILDVNEAEADKLLATIDPLAAMAEADAGKLDELLREIDTGSESLQEMLSKLAEDTGVLAGADIAEIAGVEAQKGDADRDYSASAVRSVVLIFDEEQYSAVIEAMGEHAEKFGLANNTEVVLHLLETNGYGVSGRDNTPDQSEGVAAEISDD
jgi:ParB-like chromosome segregation protein Spo0J